MKNQKLFIFFALSAFVIIILPVNVVAQESNATLSETLTWIKSKSDLINLIGAPLPKFPQKSDKIIQYFDAKDLQLDVSNQCTLSWRNLDAIKLKTPAQAKDKKPKSVNSDDLFNDRSNPPLDVSVPLAVLDPEKVEFTSIKSLIPPTIGDSSVTFWAVKLSATDNAQKILWNGLKLNTQINSFLLVFTEKQMAERFVNAFRHGIKLCGGKKSGLVKEPF